MDGVPSHDLAAPAVDDQSLPKSGIPDDAAPADDQLWGAPDDAAPADDQLLPICLIHGLFGWGEVTPLWGAAPFYFPLKELRRMRPRGTIVAVGVGALTSNHDRACEAFAQLIGARTDYGEVHAARCGHLRFGCDHTGHGLIPQWDADHPIHLIGHSLGGNTALTLVTLLAQDFWELGTSAAWVSSVSTVCSPLRGCTLPFTWGLDVPSSTIPQHARALWH